MAYGLILYKEFGNGKVEIYQNDYSGDATKIQVLAETPILNALDGSVTQIETPIIKSTCQFTIVDNGEFDFDDLFTSNATKYLVKLYDKPLSQYRQIWAGYLTPDSYATTYEPKSHITLIARDNLGMLADIDFDMTTEYSTPAQVITAMQTKIAWQMNTIDWICQQYKSGSTYIKDATISLLKYYDGDSHTWEEVVTDILRSLGQQLRYSSANQFSIVNIADIIDMQYSGVSLDYAIGNALSMEIIPSWRKYEVSQNYGKYSGYPTGSVKQSSYLTFYQKQTIRQSYLTGWDWIRNDYYIDTDNPTWKNSQGIANLGVNPWDMKMVNFLFTGTETSQQLADKASKMEANSIDCPKDYLYMYPYSSVASAIPRYIFRDLEITSGTELSIVFTLFTARFLILEKRANRNIRLLQADTSTGDNLILMSVSIGFYANSTWYQMTENGWEQSENMNIIDFRETSEASGIDSTIDFTVNVASFPCYPGTLYIRLHTMNGASYVTDQLNIFKSIVVKYPNNPSGLDLTGAINENGNITEGLNISYGEVPAECGDALAYANGLFDSSDQHYALKNWVRNDGLSSSVTSLTELIARGISHHYSCLSNGGEVIGGKILRGTIPLEHVNLLKQIFVVRDEYYKVMYASVDVKQKQANVILRQVTDYVHHGSTTYTSTPVISGSDIVTTGTNQNLSWRATDVTIQGTKRVYELGDYSAVDGAYLLLDKSGWNDAVKYPLAQILNNIMTQTEKNILTGLLQLTQDCFVRWTASTSRFTAYSHGTITFTSGGVQVAQIHTIDENMTIEVGGGSGGSSTLAGLSDVSISYPSNNQMLIYQTGFNKWLNVTPTEVKNALGLGNVDNTSDANKPVSTATQTALNAKYSLPINGIPYSDLDNEVKDSLNLADTALQPQDISGKEDKTNKVTSINSSSTDTQYPSAKCVYDAIQDIDINTLPQEIVESKPAASALTMGKIYCVDTGNDTYEKWITIDRNDGRADRYIWSQLGGGGSGVTDFNYLDNRPKYKGTLMTGSTNIPEVKTETWDAKAETNGTYPNMNVGAVINQTSGANAVKFATCTTATLPSTRDSDTIYFVV